MRFEFRFELCDQDYFDFSKATALNTPAIRKQIKAIRWLGLALLPIAIIFFSSYRVTLRPVAAVGAGIFVAVGILMFIFYRQVYDWSLRRQIKSNKKSGKLYAQGEQTLSFDDQSFIYVGSVSESRTSYDAVERVLDDNKAVYIYIGALQGHIIPGRVFQGASQREAFLQFLESKGLRVQII